MAVPKKKTSKSKRNMRRAHHGLNKVNVIIDKETGEYRMPHHLSEGRYNNRQVIIQKPKDDEESDADGI